MLDKNSWLSGLKPVNTPDTLSDEKGKDEEQLSLFFDLSVIVPTLLAKSSVEMPILDVDKSTCYSLKSNAFHISNLLLILLTLFAALTVQQYFLRLIALVITSATLVTGFGIVLFCVLLYLLPLLFNLRRNILLYRDGSVENGVHCLERAGFNLWVQKFDLSISGIKGFVLRRDGSLNMTPSVMTVTLK